LSTSPALQLVSAVCHALFYFWAATSLMFYMLADREVTTDELYAVGATFTLVAWAFAYSYTVCQAIEPGSFTAAVDPNGEDAVRSRRAKAACPRGFTYSRYSPSSSS
jgi:hypothetical protein